MIEWGFKHHFYGFNVARWGYRDTDIPDEWMVVGRLVQGLKHKHTHTDNQIMRNHESEFPFLTKQFDSRDKVMGLNTTVISGFGPMLTTNGNG